MSVPGQPGNQRAAAPWSQGHFWGQFSSPNDLVNVAGAAYQIGADLQAGDVAWVVNSGQLFACGDPTPGAAIWTAIADGLVVSAPNLFVDVATGNDSNDGLTPATALATLQAAVDLVPLTLLASVVIHVASGTYTVPFIGPRTLFSGSLAIIGDGGGQGGDDGFTELLGSTAALAGSDATNVTTVGLVVDAFQGKTIEILTGAAAGDRRTIRDNTATVITPVQDFTAAVVATDTFRIVESAVIVRVPSTPIIPPADTPSLILGVGVPAGSVKPNLQLFADPGLLLVNLSFREQAGDLISYFRVASSRVLLAGVEFFDSDPAAGAFMSFGSDPYSQILAGVDTDGSALGNGFELPFDLGLAPSSTAWVGWGLSMLTVASDALDNLVGFCVFITGSIQICLGGFWRLLGGAVESTGTIPGDLNAALIAEDRAQIYIEADTRPFLVRGTTTSRGASGIAATGGSKVQCENLTVVMAGATGSALVAASHDFSDNSLGAIEAGIINIINTCDLTAPDIGVAVSYGGQCNFNAAPTVTLTGGAIGEIATYTGAITGAADNTSTFGAVAEGASVLSATPGDGTRVMNTAT